jgi:hypothetical protein
MMPQKYVAKMHFVIKLKKKRQGVVLMPARNYLFRHEVYKKISSFII